MNRLRNIVSLVAVCATAALFTGCGEDDSPDGGGGPQPNAPESLNARTYNLADAGGTTVIAFNADGTAYTLTPSGGGAAENGTFIANKNGEVFNVELQNPAAGTNSLLVLTFTGPGTGTYTFDAPGQDQVVGNFAAASGGGDPTDDGNTTTDDGNTTTDDGNTTTSSGNGTVPAPATIPGAMNFTVTQGGVVGVGTVSHVTFSGNNFTAVNDSGAPLGSGTFTYTPSGNNAQLVMTYGGSTDADNYTLSFNEGNVGTFSGTQSAGTQVEATQGTFSF